jgi:hypothetical protein
MRLVSSLGSGTSATNGSRLEVKPVRAIEGFGETFNLNIFAEAHPTRFEHSLAACEMECGGERGKC